MIHLGLDIGGANLKAATPAGQAVSRPFALWKQPERLADALAELLRPFPPFDHLAVTMTGELCDCFPTSRAGVHAILDAVEQVAGGREVGVWSTVGHAVTPDQARRDPEAVAAANWHALAVFVGQHWPCERAVLLDVGSTTSDVIPLHHGWPIPHGQTDRARLQSGELIYTGVRRTPLSALLGPRVCAELFATTHDAYLLLGELPERPDDHDTADGRPATREHAHGRLARLLGGDRETIPTTTTLALARQVRRRQQRLLRAGWRRALRRLGGLPTRVIVAGEGEFLARSIVPAGGEIISLRQQLGPEASTAACAVAMAALASDAKHAAPWVVKVGGSLFDWPDLTSRLTVWLATLPTRRIVLVPGGGAAADVVRAWDHDHELGDVAAHWLALRSLTLTAYFLAGRLPDGQVVNGWSECGAVWARGGVPVLDANAFVRADEGRPGALPHTWDATSDAIAARVAVRGAADRLVMLKSADPPNDNWRSGVSGYVDPICGRIAAEAAVRLEAVNLRSAAGVTALGGSPRASGGRQPSVEETTS